MAKSIRTFATKIAFWSILVVFLYAATEFTAWVSYRILFKENFSFSGMAESRAKNFEAAEKQGGSEKPATYLLHPYYGYVIDPAWNETYHRDARSEEETGSLIDDPINAYGFFSPIPSILPAEPKNLVVAITGGSVATYAAAWGRETWKKGLAQIPAFKGREIIIVNLASFAYKQPQQVSVVGDILSQGGHIDLLIDIDGFNEIALPRAHDAFTQGSSPFFPQSWRLTSESKFSREDMMRLGRIALVQNSRAACAALASRFPLRDSIAVATLYRIVDNSLVKQKSALEQSLGKESGTKFVGAVPTTTDGRTALGPPHTLKDARELYEASASLWARGSVLLNNMIASQGGLYIHILQPNQYFPGSRPQGADDPKTISADSKYKPEVEHGYPYLRSAGVALQRADINFFDLSALFKDDPDPVFRDNCCHLTKAGNIKFIGAIVARVADAVSKDSKPRAVLFADADYRLETLRALAFRPDDYNDGSGIELK